MSPLADVDHTSYVPIPAHLKDLPLPLAWFEHFTALVRQLEQVEAERDRYREALRLRISNDPMWREVLTDEESAALHPKERDDG